MVSPKLEDLVKVFLLLVFLFFTGYRAIGAATDWKKIDSQLEGQIFRINVGLKLKLKDQWINVSGLSTNKKYYVFTSSRVDKGFRVVGYGSAFPIAQNNQQLFFVTNKHVINNAVKLSRECQMFFAAMMFYAKNQLGDEKKFAQVLKIVNLGDKKNRTLEESRLYEDTVNAIWQCYDSHLSEQADKSRVLYKQYKNLVPISGLDAYFLRGKLLGANSLAAKLYKVCPAEDLEILVTDILPGNARFIKSLPVNLHIYTNEPVQISGFPVVNRDKENKPIFCAAKIRKIDKKMFELEAEIAKGESGGPVINQEGEVVGIITRKSANQSGKVLPDRGVAIKMTELKQCTPELFITSVRKSRMAQ